MVAYALVVLFAALVGVGELVARYRDAPTQALIGVPALFYVLVNAVAGAGALYVIDAFGWTFGVTGQEAIRLTQVMVAGFGSMALFRSALFNVRVGDTDVGVGPSGLLKIVLDAADRAVDRERAKPRALRVAEIMDGVVFEKAKQALPSFCFSLMQNVSAEEQTVVGKEVRSLEASPIPDRVKMLNLGLVLLDLVGEDVLESAVNQLSSEIKFA